MNSPPFLVQPLVDFIRSTWAMTSAAQASAFTFFQASRHLPRACFRSLFGHADQNSPNPAGSNSSLLFSVSVSGLAARIGFADALLAACLHSTKNALSIKGLSASSA